MLFRWEITHGPASFWPLAFIMSGHNRKVAPSLIKAIDSKIRRPQLNNFYDLGSNIPFDLRKNVEKYENYYHTIFFVLVRLIGMDIHAEYHTSEGSIDIVIKTDRFLYIIELKINGTAKEAIKQIESRQYTVPFMNTCQRVFKIGIGFAQSTHTIDSYIIE